jgi:hypothetical protein
VGSCGLSLPLSAWGSRAHQLLHPPPPLLLLHPPPSAAAAAAVPLLFSGVVPQGSLSKPAEVGELGSICPHA